MLYPRLKSLAVILTLYNSAQVTSQSNVSETLSQSIQLSDVQQKAEYKQEVCGKLFIKQISTI